MEHDHYVVVTRHLDLIPLDIDCRDASEVLGRAFLWSRVSVPADILVVVTLDAQQEVEAKLKDATEEAVNVHSFIAA